MKYLPLEKLVKEKDSEALILQRLFPFLDKYFSEQGIQESLRAEYAFIVLKKSLQTKTGTDEAFYKSVLDLAKEYFLEQSPENDLVTEDEGRRRALAQNLDILKQIEGREKVLSLLHSLPPEQRELSYARYFERKNAPQIAVDLGLSLGEVNRRLLLSLESLSQKIIELGDFVQASEYRQSTPFDKNITDIETLKHRYATGEMSAAELEGFLQAASDDEGTRQSLRLLYHLETWMIKTDRYVMGAKLSEKQINAFIQDIKQKEQKNNKKTVLPVFHLPTLFLGIGILLLIILIFTIFYISAS